jgi:hypothetical protein
MRVQFSGFLALSAQATLAEFCERTSNVWNTQNLRVHLGKKLTINPNKIVVKNANETLDVGTCDCDGKGQCFAESKTPIEFIIDGNVCIQHAFS